MRILIVGAGRGGARVIRQLQKNPNLTLLIVDPVDEPFAVREGIIERVDFKESLTPLNLEYVLEQARPDLMILTRTAEDMGMGTAPGLDILAEALREEIAALSEIPVIELARGR
jgi:FlaA1/EpsC-like NDP-sugar epimerase